MANFEKINIKWKEKGVNFVITDNENDISITYNHVKYALNVINVWVVETGDYVGRFTLSSNVYQWDKNSGIY